MPALTNEQQELLEHSLRKRYRSLIAEVQEELGPSGQQHFADFAEAGGSDQGDESVADALADIAAARVDRQIREMREIEVARKCMKRGEYGVCADCGQAIPFERLQAYPTALRCVLCQEQWEKFRAPGATPSL